jgi:hypothetical protein
MASAFVFNLADWKEISTYGTKNCGIFVSQKYPEYIMKCETDTRLHDEDEVKTTRGLFPEIIDIHVADEKKYIVMEKLDGDLTQFFTEQIPAVVLSKLPISDKQKEEIQILSHLKFPHFMVEKSHPELNTFTVTPDMYDTFISKVFEMYDSVYEDIMKKLIKLYINAILQGFTYDDKKFDNIGYKDEGGDLKLLFIDWGSGLSRIEPHNAYIEINDFIESVNSGMKFAVFHQTSFDRMFGLHKDDSIENKHIKTILEKPYFYDMTKFKKNFKTVDEVERYVGLEPRLMGFFLENGYALEDPEIVRQREAGVPEIDYVIHEMTALMTAIYNIWDGPSSLERVRQLLAAGANPSIVTGRDKSAMTYALHRKHPEVIDLLLRYGAILPPKALYLALGAKANAEFIQFLFYRGMPLPPDIRQNFLLYAEDYEDDPEMFEAIKGIVAQKITNSMKGGRKRRTRRGKAFKLNKRRTR